MYENVKNKKQIFFKKIKIIALNVLLVLLLFHVADYYASLKCIETKGLYTKYSSPRLIIYWRKIFNMENFKFSFDNQYVSGKYFRPLENPDANEDILLFGCSYAYGKDLYDNQTFSYWLGIILPKYRIHNISQCGWTTSHMLYHILNESYDVPNVKYIIYVFIGHHINRNRICYFYKPVTPYYVYKNDKFCLQKYSLNYIRVPLLLYVKQLISEHMDLREISDLTEKLLEYSMLKAKLKYRLNTKFIIFRYENVESQPYNQMFEDLKEKGFIVVSLNDLSSKNYITKKYQLDKYGHPSAQAWQEITPLFVKYLQDRGYFKD